MQWQYSALPLPHAGKGAHTNIGLSVAAAAAARRFRGNMPTNDTDSSKPVFAYDTLLSYMRTKAAQAGVTLPDDLYLIDISLVCVCECP